MTLQSGQPSSVQPGATTVLEITLSNNNDTSVINSVGFSNTLPGVLPDGLKVAGPATFTCFDPLTSATSTPAPNPVTAPIGSQSLTLTNATIPQRNAASSTDGSCTLLLPVTPGTSSGGTATRTFTIADGDVTGNDGSAVQNIGNVSQSINVLALNRPTISKAFSNGTAILGGAARTLTITVGNSNTSVAIPDFDITDTFPTQGAGGAIIQVANPPNATSTCPGAGGVAPTFTGLAPGATSITVEGGTVAPSGTCTITVEVEARHTNGGYQTSNLNNTINASSDFTNEIGIGAQSNATARIRARSPLAVTKSFSPSSLSSGENATMTIRFTNSGDAPLTVDSFSDSPIDSIVHATVTEGLRVDGPIAVSCPGGTNGVYNATANNEGIEQTAGAINRSTIAAGNSCTLTVPVLGQTQSANTPITYTNNLPPGAVDVGDTNIISQNRSATILVADTLRVLKARATTDPRPGNPVQFSITVQNWSAGALSDVQVVDALANGMTYLTGVIGGNDYSPVLSGGACGALTVTGATGATVPEFTVGTVPARASISSPGQCVITFYAMTDPNATNGSSTVNTIPAGSVCTNNGAGFCNGGSASSPNSPVVAEVLEIDKSFAPAGPLPEGSVTRMRIELSNYSANPTTDLSISDTLPITGSVQMMVATPPNASTTCGGTITAVAGSTSVALNNGGIPARASLGAGAAGTCILEIDVVGAAGVYSNDVTATGVQTFANGTTSAVAPVMDTAPFTFTSVLSSSKSFSPGNVASGGRSTATIEMNNSGSDPLNNVSVTDPLPAGMVLASPTNAYTTCNGTTTITGNPGDSSISLTGASIAGSGTCGLIFDVTATGSADWVNTIPIGGIEAVGSGVINQAAVSGTLLFSSGSALTIAKATNPSTLTFPGQESRLVITITNGTQAVSNLSLSDFFTMDGTSGAMPNGMVLTSNPSAQTDCPAGIVTAVPNSDSLRLSGAALSAGQTCTYSANVTSTTIGGITNFIPVGAISTSEGLSNAGQATTSLTTQTSLGVTKQFTPNVIVPGARSRLRLSFFNPTANLATNLAVIDTLPAGVTVPAGANPVSACFGATITSPAPNQVQVTGGILAAAINFTPATCYVEIDVTATAEGSYLNTIPAGDLTAEIGGMPSSNSEPATDTLRAMQPLEIHKAIDNQTLDLGDPAGLTTGTAIRPPGVSAVLRIVLINPNTTPLTQTSLIDSLPSGLVVATTPTAATSCAGGLVNATALGTSVTLTGATIPASASCEVTVNVSSNIPGSYVNSIPGNAVNTFEGVSNTEDTSAEIVISAPPTIGKQFAPAVIPPNGVSTLIIVIGNENDAAITLTSALVDTLPTLPGAVVIAGTPNAQTTCTGTVSASAGGASVQLNNSAVIPPGGCSVQVDVTAATSGQHNNNIPAGALQTDAGDNALAANSPLIVSTEGYISGTVFQDNDVIPNGIFAPVSDAPIAGVTINLYSGSSCAGVPLQTTVTDAQGAYLFFGLPAGTYSVCEQSQPPGTTNGIPTSGAIVPIMGSTGTTGTASNPDSSSSQITGIVLNADGAGGETSGSPGNNFAEVVTSSISGQVFLDINNNGLFNGPDMPLAGELIELLDAGNTVIQTTNTDASGNYSFTGLQPGTYSVRQPNQPADTTPGITTPGSVPNGGTVGVATNPAVAPSVIATIVLPPNTESPNNDFAEISNGRVLSGNVFFDFDDSGTLDGPDFGLGAQIIDLTGTDINGNPIAPRQTTTAADGSYSFVGLPEGTYTVTQPNQPADSASGATIAGTAGGVVTNRATTPSEISGINLTGAVTVSAANDFAEIPDPGPDLALSKTHTPSTFGAGSSTGFFTLFPQNIGTVDTSGTITVTDNLPAGMTLAAVATGTGWICTGGPGATVVSCSSSDVISAGGSGAAIVVRVLVDVSAASQVLVNTASISGGGELPGFTGNNSGSDSVAIGGVARVSGTVWSDDNLDNILDMGERGQSRWIVELFLNGVLVQTVLTDTSGDYALENIAPGSGYDIVFRDPVDGNVFGPPVSNERGLAPVAGRDPSTNPAGATATGGGLTGLTLFDGDDIIEQSLPLDPATIPIAPSLGIPTLPQWAMLLLIFMLLLLGRSSLSATMAQQKRSC
ncbi:MAG: SdrD B-like domain-containing protein [Halioglobus sp.]